MAGRSTDAHDLSEEEAAQRRGETNTLVQMCGVEMRILPVCVSVCVCLCVCVCERDYARDQANMISGLKNQYLCPLQMSEINQE